MEQFFDHLSNWSEVWALVIPLFFIARNKKIPVYLKPIRLYVILAVLINTFAILIQEYKLAWGFKPGDFLWSNNFLYNLHSVVRLLMFSWFFILIGQRFMHRVKLIVPIVFIILVFVNFIFFENFFDTILSSRLLATEAALLLFYCLQYFIYLMIEERHTRLNKQPGFWVVAGLSIYVATSFFIFLFYTYLVKQDWRFAVDIWDVHNIAYLILCIGIARAFYVTHE
jgi:hypothetical protein